MISKHNSLDYKLETRLRNRLFNDTHSNIKISLFEELYAYSNKLYVNNTLAFHNALWDELKHE